MIRHLTRVGDQFAIVIDPSILELLGIDESTPLDVRTDGIGFQIVPAPANTARRPPSSPSQRTSAPPSTPPAAPTPATASSTPPSTGAASPPPTTATRSTPNTGAASSKPRTPAQVSSEGLAQAFDAPPSQTMEVRHLDEVDELDERDASDERDGHEAGTPMVVVVRDGQVVLEYPFTVDEIVIGRNRLANIPLDDRALSRDHAKLARRGASFWVSDLGSANGTYVGAERITEPRLLRSGDVVVIGHYQLRIDGVEEAPTDTPVLTISGPDGTHRFGMVGADIVVGRADDCDVAINNRSISRRHLQISRGAQRGSFVATNISGHNVVKVDGMPIDEPTPFSLGSQIEIGDFTITVGYLDGNGEQKDSTMVIDRTALAKAAYIDGDYGDASAGSHATSRR